MGAGLQSATLAARAATGDRWIAVQASRGLVDVVRAVPPAGRRGTYSITILAAGLTVRQAVDYLHGMAVAHGAAVPN